MSPTQTEKLGAFYRENGESEHVAIVEAALTDDWMSTVELVEASGKSRNYVSILMPYLHAEGRADRRQAPLERPVRGQTWQWEWRRPTVASEGKS